MVALEIEIAPEASKAVRSDGATSGVPTSINALRTVGRVAQTDIGAQLNLEELLVVDPSQSSGPRPVAGAESLLSDEPTDSAIARRIARLAKAVERTPRNGASAPALYDVQSGLAAFCRGAGMDAEKLPPDAQTRLLHLTGQLLREALVGLKDLERSRAEIRNRFRIEISADPEDPRPSLTRLTVEELLIALFVQHETRSTDAVQWLREALAATKEHENAVSQAMRTAFGEFLDRLDPAELEARFERAARRGKSKSSDRAQYWELYTEFYRNLYRDARGPSTTHLRRGVRHRVSRSAEENYLSGKGRLGRSALQSIPDVERTKPGCRPRPRTRRLYFTIARVGRRHERVDKRASRDCDLRDRSIKCRLIHLGGRVEARSASSRTAMMPRESHPR